MIDLLNLDAERETCAALLFHGREAWDAIRPSILAPDQFSPTWRGHYRVLLSLAERGTPATAPTMREAAFALGENQLAESVEEWTAALFECLGTVESAGHHATIVADLGRRRALVDLARQIGHRAVDRSVPVSEVVSDGVGRMMAATQIVAASQHSDGILDALEELERHAALGGGLPGISTGIDSLDELLEGYCPGRLVVLAARPGVGKTAFATFSAHTAASNDHEVLFVTLEQPARQLQMRRLALSTGVNLFRVKRNPNEWHAVSKTVHAAANALKAMPLTFNEQADTATAIALAAQRHSATIRPVQLLVVDYLSWIRFEAKAERNDIGIGVITKRLAKTAKDLGCCVLLLAQLNRESVKDGKSRRPTLADLRDSGAIEQDADQVVLMWEPPAPDGSASPTMQTTIELTVAKNRHGPLGHSRMGWLKGVNQYRDEERYLRAVA